MKLEPLKPKSDSRGSLLEAFQLPNDGLVVYMTTLPNEMRGNHYHLRKTEHFIVIWGSAIFNVKDRDSGDVMKVETNATKPMVVTVVPNHTHNIVATDQGSLILTWVSEKFDPKDPDTYPEEV
jgi:UDP-2-acetamido-2,6-beta-L-arabino-hexul-4-ose reductase